MRKAMEGSYTVEAAFVMSIALFFICALLQGIFAIHSRVVGKLVLQEGMERCERLEEEQSEDDLEERTRRWLRGFFQCGKAELELNSLTVSTAGTVRIGTEHEIYVKRVKPETYLRLLAAAMMSDQGEQSGSTLQERD